MWGSIKPEQDLEALSTSIESGSRGITGFGSGRAPRGPVGIKGELTTLYVDEDLRIAGGSQTPWTDARGVVRVAGRSNLLFVFTRDEAYGPRRW